VDRDGACEGWEGNCTAMCLLDTGVQLWHAALVAACVLCALHLQVFVSAITAVRCAVCRTHKHGAA
jgi:hypothetical protein